MSFPDNINPARHFPKDWFISMINGSFTMGQRIHLSVWQYQNKNHKTDKMYSPINPLDVLSSWSDQQKFYIFVIYFNTLRPEGELLKRQAL